MRVVFRKVSDEDLLDAQFEIGDPLALPFRVDIPPEPEAELTYIGWYRSVIKVRCVFGHLHNAGYVFEDVLKRQFLIGNVCGQKHLGMESWADFERERKQIASRASYLRQIAALKTAFSTNIEWIEHMLQDEAVAAFLSVRDVAFGLGPLYHKTGTFIDAGGRVSVSERVRDFEAEDRRESREERDRANGLVTPTREGSYSPIFKMMSREVGTLRGSALFRMSSISEDEHQQTVRAIKAFVAGKVTPREPSALKQVSMNARRLVDRIASVRTDVASATEFFDESNLDLFVAWCKEDHASGYLVERIARGVRVVRAKRSVELFRPAKLKPLSDHRFSALQAATHDFYGSFVAASTAT